ncbi:hypothetical protein FLAT13_01874 [Flavobacterium salmonis]|uniref:Uncharacterized protein n=1 Tax=Flavobacterium salmonis TaxID=2654844 RepID=A0A6V6YWA0_9FLAO|nr:hypothetical protein FLAT13_01874 [Flavobacterium salmonis]
MTGLILLIIISLVMTSCNSQTDLETLKIDTKIAKKIKDMHEGSDELEIIR